jgi:hypothetical protein
VTHLWVPGEPIQVTMKAPSGNERSQMEPDVLTWRNQIHKVDQITRVWRVDLDWWRERVWRTYYKLSTHTGLLIIIYEDLLSKEWFLQRLYD